MSVPAPTPRKVKAVPSPQVAQRAQELLREQLRSLAVRVDRSFAILMGCQYVLALLLALIAPGPAHGSSYAANLWLAVLLGAVITGAPVALALLRPGRAVTRYTVAVCQMMMSALLIHLTGGRIETHFHVFGSLAFLAFYRDWRVLATASGIAVANLLLRGMFWPESVFGVAHPHSWRWLEHTAWLIFENAFLILSIQHNLVTLRTFMQNRAELEAARDRAEQASRAKDDFLAVLSHELRTPLTPSLLALSAMADDEQIDPGVRKDLAMVRRNVELEARLIDDLLDLTRIATGKLQLVPGNVDLHQLLAELLETFEGEFAAKGIAVERQFAAERPWLYGDGARLQQVFWNLLKNALKFTPAGGRISVRTSDANDRIRVDVTDSGMGIAPDVLPRLFERFEQGGAEVTRQFGGLGLGLSICRAIVEMHRGAIRAESRGPGWGATFTVVLPARVGAPAARPGVQSQLLRLNGVLPRRVLLVDDHPDTRETLARLLTRANYQVTQAGTVRSALQKAEQATFDILVSDIGLPDGSGCDLMKALRERHELRGVAFSGYGMEEDVQRSLQAGFSAHLTKPVDFQRLKEAMGQALQNPSSAAAA
jgi:signal transduction histidine kinase/ActR/RegA family two-component response regulator